MRHPTTVFRAGDTFAWAATLRKRVSAPALTLTVKRAESVCPRGVTVGSSTLRVAAKSYRVVGKVGPVSSLTADGATIPGHYTMVVSDRGRELARGSFRLAGSPGPGSIRFGRSYARSPDGTLNVQVPQTRFGPRDTLAWVATFWMPSRAQSLRLVVAKLTGCKLTPVVSTSALRADPRATQFANSVAASTLGALGVRRPGGYVMRYERNGMTLASGWFELH